MAQVLNRLTYIASLSHLRRISTPTDKSGKLVPPRKLHSTSYGYLCPAECFDPDTEILMWDGTYTLAKDIIVGVNLYQTNEKTTRNHTPPPLTKKVSSGFHWPGDHLDPKF